MKRVALALTLVLPVLLGACNSSTSSPPPIIPLRLYAANESLSGPALSEVVWYGQPFSGTSTPAGTISGIGGAFAVAIDPTNPAGAVYVYDQSANAILAYPRPNPNASAPMFTVKSGVSSGEINFDVHGNFYFINFTDFSVNTIAHPVTSTSTSTKLILTATHVPQCAAADPAGNLFVLDAGAPSPHRVYEYTPPYTGAPISTTSNMTGITDACAMDPVTNQFFVGNNQGSVLGFNTPLTPGAVPAVILPSSFNGTDGAAQYGIAFDPSGNLYIASVVYTAGVITSATISVYTGPAITSSQTPAFSFTNASLTSPTSISRSFQLAIGI